ncbi:PHP domain-containing protein, partial [Staphylococcus aureus]
AGLPWIAPELRHATGEIEAAAAGRLPRLLTRDDVRGDLHMHSTYSDGQDSIESMVIGCIAQGFEYMAVTDHSERAAAARTLTLDDLARQRD